MNKPQVRRREKIKKIMKRIYGQNLMTCKTMFNALHYTNHTQECGCRAMETLGKWRKAVVCVVYVDI